MAEQAGAFVFVSYARADREVVARLLNDLRERGVACWVDEQGLKPGTPSWEQALREAIRAASAVLLVASPASRASRYVPDELRIAEMYQRPIVPVWVDGTQWMESIPMGWGGTQTVDARGERYTAALAALVTTVRETIASCHGCPCGPCRRAGGA